MTELLSIADDYTKFPTGRYKEHGDGSGEEFRDDYLVPLLTSGKSVVVELSGTAGYASSFLEEAFGGLVRQGIAIEIIKDHLKIKATEASFKSYELLAKKYLDEAIQRSLRSV